MIATNMNELAAQITAYPYLNLSRKYKAIGTTLTYADVLHFADAYKKHFRDLNVWQKAATERLQRSPIAEEIITIHKTMDEYVASNR